MSAGPAYDRMGIGYAPVRQPDPRIAAAIWDALGDAATVLNVGAGAGSYEPRDREVVAVEPSPVMIAQRPPDAARAVQASAEALPFADDSFDAAMAVLTIHHWHDLEAGLREVVRVARRIVIVTIDPEPLADLWLIREYFPQALEIHAKRMPPIADLVDLLPDASATPLPIPAGCRDGFFAALWDRPEAHLDPRVRQASSFWHDLTAEQIDHGVAALRRDLESGVWDERHGHLRTQPELDTGLRLVVAGPSPASV